MENKKSFKEFMVTIREERVGKINEAKLGGITKPGKGQTVKNRMWELASYAMHTLWASLNPFFPDDPGEFTGKQKATVEKMYADGLAHWNKGDYKWIVDNLLQKTARLWGTSDFWADMTWGESEHGFYGGGNWTGPGFDPKKGKASERSKIVK